MTHKNITMLQNGSHSKQTTFITGPFITDLFKTDHFHNRPCS